MSSSQPIGHFEQALSQAFGVTGTLKPLDGEFDLNFLVVQEDQPTHVLKVMRPNCDPQLVDMQCAVLDHLTGYDAALPIPSLVRSLDDQPYVSIKDQDGHVRLVWCIGYLPGETYTDFSPKTRKLLWDLGSKVGQLSNGLADFQHPGLDRGVFKWDLMQGLWIREQLDVIHDDFQRQLVHTIADGFDASLCVAKSLPTQALHNDINDQNLLVTWDEQFRSSISAMLDFGDLCSGPRVIELSIAAAYAILHQNNPMSALTELVKGFHEHAPLSETELELVYPFLKMRLAVSVVNSAIMKQQRPDDPYVVISEKPAWTCLERLSNISDEEVLARLRVCCGMSVVTTNVLNDLTGMVPFAHLLGVDLNKVPMVDLSVTGDAVPRDPTDMQGEEALSLGAVAGHDISVSYYAEPRLIYTAPEFITDDSPISNRRTVHTAVDIFAPAGTNVYAPLEGVVTVVQNRDTHLDYGGLVILEHQTPSATKFWTLYGHLDPSVVNHWRPGDAVASGQRFAELGQPEVNGGWAPHLHFQMALLTQGVREDWLAAADPDDAAFWCQVYPNPAVLLNLNANTLAYRPLDDCLLRESRERQFSKSLKLSYDDPCLLVRGWKHYLYDAMGRTYLDAYNNVPHVGHAHPRIQAVVAKQWAKLNTNTRYLNPVQTELSEALLKKLPDPLSVCFFVNSASEANEVALRLAQIHTGGEHMIVPDHGYHGITTGAMALSAYKFNGPGGQGAKDWVHVVEVPDTFRGPYKDTGAGALYAENVDRAIENIQKGQGRLAGFIAESFPSVGGQLVPPKGYLKNVYQSVRSAGGVCIADEVQTGLGRLGDYYWGFEQQDVVPDMVVLGKPLGSGHPVAALVTTREIAESFVTGMEFFSTFGGSTVSCVVAREVLDIVDEERLQDNAKTTGDYLLEGLKELVNRHPLVGDARGMGFFIGVELVLDAKTLEPATSLASYVKNRLRDHRILIGTDGPHDNVLKIRPPLTFSHKDADLLLATLDNILQESPCVIS